jgi:protein-S-isoprenylcysteine O-methyltransferase Ste14
MFKGTQFEFRHRYVIHFVLFFTGFLAPWYKVWPEPHGLLTWLAVAEVPARLGWLTLYASTLTVTALGAFFAIAGAVFRTWGTAYMSAGVVKDAAMHGGAVVADGPYRYMRNPLYVGTWLHTLMLVLLMQPAGAVFTVIAIGVFQLRLIGGEEAFLPTALGEPYLAYCAKVPRLFPALTPRVPAAGRAPKWGSALLLEIYFIGAAVSFAVVAWRFNGMLLGQCLLGSLGVSIVVKAFLPGVKTPQSATE